MDLARSSGSGSGNSGTYTAEAAETLRFEEEIQSLMTDSLSYHNGIGSPPSTGGGGSYFTALLGLPPSQAVELLHDPDHAGATAAGAADSAADSGGSWRIKALRVPPGCSPTFPSNAALVERAARFSVFAAEDSPPPPPAKPKAEPEDSDPPPQRPAKRKEMERSKGRGTSKKSRTAAEENTGGEQLPYVHVRARRGQATDSHSLAERARREKINARMKLLQELVPGCSKITGTALVLDEIINHVQSLQRHVEFLSMRLAAVNPRIDYCGVDSFLTVEQYRRLTAINGRSNGMLMEQPLHWAEEGSHEGRRPNVWHVDIEQHRNDRQEPVEDWERDNAATPHEFINPSATSLFPPESATSASLSNQLKAEHKW